MLQNIRDNSQGWIAKTIIGLIVVLMALTGFEAIFQAASHSQDAAKVIQAQTGGAHAAVVTAVAKGAFDSAVDALRAGGRLVAVGLPSEAMNLNIPRLVLDGIEVIGSLVGTRQDLQEAFQFAAEGKVVPKVSLRPIEDINQIFEEMLDGRIKGRMVIQFEG